MKRKGLTPRQIDILRLSCKSNAEIANRLNLTLNWVIEVQARIRKRLGVHNKCEAIAKAAQLGYIDIFDVEVSEE